MSTVKLYATLIGIDDYKHNPLNGCIKDVLKMDAFLRELCRQQGNGMEYVPLYLLAPNGHDRQLLKSSAIAGSEIHAPTFSNVSTIAFDHLGKAGPNDVCVFYYSGHGSQIESAPEFAYTKSDRKSETIVCVDSRDGMNAGSRDLIDKELAYLLWRSLRANGPHCLVIMDCCHAGNNTRGTAAATTFRSRMDAPSSLIVPLDQYIGFNDPAGFYDPRNGRASIKDANYVKLSAAQDFEKALETDDGGVFTSRLVACLEAGGTARSYQSIIQQLGVSVNNRASDQHPVIEAFPEADMHRSFLKNDIVPYRQTFAVRYANVNGDMKWVMYVGAMQGITASAGNERSLVRVVDGLGKIDVEAEIVATTSELSILSGAGLSSLDINAEHYSAWIFKLAGAAIHIGLTDALKANADLVNRIAAENEKRKPLYADIDFFGQIADPEYVIDVSEDGMLMLCRPPGKMPLFKRTNEIALFLDNANTVGRWQSIAAIVNSSAGFRNEFFDVKLEIVEGQDIRNAANPDGLKGETVDKFQLEDDIRLSYQKGYNPGFRYTISIRDTAPVSECYVGVLYMSSDFGVTAGLVPASAGKLVKGKGAIEMRVPWATGAAYQRTVPVVMNKSYLTHGIIEITDLLRIFVSTQPLDLSRFAQDQLETDVNKVATREVKTRGIGYDDDNGGLTAAADWMVFTHRVLIRRQEKQQVLSEGGTDFSAFKVKVPVGFQAKATAITASDLNGNFRSADNLGNPAAIWGDVLTDSSAFGNSLQQPGNNLVQALELEVTAGLETISEDAPIVISPTIKTSATRSADQPEEVTIPYGFDAESGLYYPLGYSDNNGNVLVTRLPAATPGTLSAAAISTRSIGSSIKLYFCKMFRKPVFGIALYSFADNLAEPLATDPGKMEKWLGKPQSKRILLLVHGIFGDTKGMLASAREMPELAADTEYVMTFDYENLAGSIADSARNLYEALKKSGLAKGGNKVTIVAHSMGGLVSRYMIEFKDGADFVKHLVLVGTPSKGSDITKLPLGIVSLITHALNVTGPVKYVLTGLSFLLKKLKLDATHTLQEMQPDTKIINELAKGQRPESVRYSLLGGDTAQLDRYTGADHFLQKLADAIKRNVVYPGLTARVYDGLANDMAVTVDSMKGVPGLNGHGFVDIVPCDHISYFQDAECRRLLLQYLQHEA